MIDLRAIPFAELETAATFPALVAEYLAESQTPGMPPAAVRFDIYRDLEAKGLLHVLATFAADRSLVGFLILLMSVHPKYGVGFAASESFFVARSHRAGGAGLKLLRAGEALARELGSPGLLVSAPFDGDLAKVLPRVGYRESNRVFFKVLPPREDLPVVVETGCGSSHAIASIPAMSSAQVDQVAALEAAALERTQVDLPVDHFLHGGIYARTVLVPAGVLITGALIKIPTVLIVRGDAMVYVGDESHRLTGYAVLPAAAHRKQAFCALAPTHLTMIFPTGAATVEDAEREFTDEVEKLQSRRDAMWGRPSCQE